MWGLEQNNISPEGSELKKLRVGGNSFFNYKLTQIKREFLNTDETDFYTDNTDFFEFAGTRERETAKNVPANCSHGNGKLNFIDKYP